MTTRRMLLGLVGGVAMCGAATAMPPRAALSEGRELDPVTRDYYLGEPQPEGEQVDSQRAAETPGDVFGWAVISALSETLLNQFTMPLGTAPSGGAR